jgi:hypothetical protein
LPDAGGQHLAHDDFGYLLGRNTAAGEQDLDEMCTQICCRHFRNRAAEFADPGS